MVIFQELRGNPNGPTMGGHEKIGGTFGTRDGEVGLVVLLNKEHQVIVEHEPLL